MRWEYVNWNWFCYTSPKGKTEAAERPGIPLSDRVLDILKRRHLKQGLPAQGWVFPTSRSKTGHLTTINQVLRNARRKAGLPEALVPYCGRQRLWHDSDGRDRRSKTRGHPYGSPRHQNHDALQPSAQGTGRAYSRSPEHPQVYDTILCVATKFSTLCQPIPGAATSAVHSQVAFFQKLAEVLLESIPTCAGQCNYIADGDASVFTRILEDFHGQFGYGR
jgi:hypothetical protein